MITQIMTFTATPPTTGENPTTFNYNAIACWNDLKNNIVPDLNTAFGQMNTLEANINLKENIIGIVYNYKGEYTTQTTTIGETYSFGGYIYVVKVAGNSNPIASPSNWQIMNIAYQIMNTPSGSISSTNIQDAINELDSSKVSQDSATGAAYIPSGTTAQRPVAPSSGYMRFNTTLSSAEVWNGTMWTPVGGGSTGGGSDQVFVETSYTITQDYTITTGKSAMTVGNWQGNVTIPDGINITVPDDSSWVILGA